MSIDFASMFAEALDETEKGDECDNETPELKHLSDASDEGAFERLVPAARLHLTLPPSWRTTCRIPCRDAVWVVPNAIGKAQECDLARLARAANDIVPGKWIGLKGRRVQEWGVGTHSLPPYLQCLADDLSAETLWGAGVHCNHVLINEYDLEGGIMPHTDGPAYVPTTATLSLFEPALFRFSVRRGHEPDGAALEDIMLYLQPRDLVVFSEGLYTTHTHEILPAKNGLVEVPEGCLNALPQHQVRTRQRLSLTFRHML